MISRKHTPNWRTRDARCKFTCEVAPKKQPRACYKITAANRKPTTKASKLAKASKSTYVNPPRGLQPGCSFYHATQFAGLQENILQFKLCWSGVRIPLAAPAFLQSEIGLKRAGVNSGAIRRRKISFWAGVGPQPSNTRLHVGYISATSLNPALSPQRSWKLWAFHDFLVATPGEAQRTGTHAVESERGISWLRNIHRCVLKSSLMAGPARPKRRERFGRRQPKRVFAKMISAQS